MVEKPSSYPLAQKNARTCGEIRRTCNLTLHERHYVSDSLSDIYLINTCRSMTEIPHIQYTLNTHCRYVALNNKHWSRRIR